MASNGCPPSPLLVRVSQPGTRLQRKLEKYFQSRESGGGECTVQALDRNNPDTFRVQFLQRAGERLARAGGATAILGAWVRADPVQRSQERVREKV